MAGTVRTRAGLLTEDTNVYINDNTSGDIDPVDHRTSNEDHSASAPNFLDDNFTIDGDGSHKYTVDPTGAWDGTATHDLKFIPKKWFDDNKGSTISGTDNYVPIFNATGDNVEDSNLRQIFATSLGQDVNSLIFEDSGIEDNKVFNLTGSGANTSLNKLTFTFDLANTTTLLPNWQAELTANGSKFLAERATTFGSIDIDFARMQIPDGSLAQISSIRSVDAPSGTPIKYFHVSSGVDYMGHKYGGSDADPAPVSLTNNYSFFSWASEQKVAIGYASGVGSHNAHLVIQSVTGTPNQRPHLKLTGGFNEGATTPDNGSIWLSSNDSKVYLRSSTGSNIALEDGVINVSTGTNGFAVGGATSASAGGVAIGNLANGGSNLTTIAIGDGADVTGTRGISIGWNTSSESGVAIGISSSSTGGGNAFGGSSVANGTFASAYGAAAQATAGSASALGASAEATAASAIAVGNATVAGTRAIGIGDGIVASTTDSILIGTSSSVTGNNGYSIGRGNVVGANGISFGFQAGNGTGTIGSDAISIGTDANGGTANIGASSIVIGKNTDSTVTGAVTLGYGTAFNNRLVNSTTNSFGLGWGSNTPDFLYSKAGQWLVKSLPTFADDTSAGVGGVATDEIYKTATGELRIKL
jgi:hypothetical protein